MLLSPTLLLTLVLIALATSAPVDHAAIEMAARSERSANLSHITGTSRKIQLFIKNRNLQLMPDGTVNGTDEDSSDFSILQRTTVNIGQLKIQGIATCLHLCMDSCGLLYGSRDLTSDCIFNEQMEQHHYNTYSRTSTGGGVKKTSFVAFNAKGQPRRLQLPFGRPLGKLSAYARVLTRNVPPARVAALRPHHLRHRRACATGAPAPHAEQPTAPAHCRRRRRRRRPAAASRPQRRCRPGQPCLPEQIVIHNIVAPPTPEDHKRRRHRGPKARRRPAVRPPTSESWSEDDLLTGTDWTPAPEDGSSAFFPTTTAPEAVEEE